MSLQTMPTSEVLHKAADLIDSRGWTVGNEGWAEDNDSPLCLEGGIAAAMGMRAMQRGCNLAFTTSEGLEVRYLVFTECPAYKAVERYLVEADRLEHGDDWACALWSFNDHQHEATAVTAVLRAAAEVEYLREQQDEAYATYAENLAAAAA